MSVAELKHHTQNELLTEFKAYEESIKAIALLNSKEQQYAAEEVDMQSLD